MIEGVIAWSIIVLGFVLPLGHVALSPAGGPWTPPPGARCPLGPRAGWVVLVLLLGPVGWLLYMRARTRRARRDGRAQVLKKEAAAPSR